MRKTTTLNGNHRAYYLNFLAAFFLTIRLFSQPTLWYESPLIHKANDFTAVNNGQEVWVATEHGIRVFSAPGALATFININDSLPVISLSNTSSVLSNEVIYAGGGGYTKWTTDGGNTWSTLDTSNSNLTITDTVREVIGNSNSGVWFRLNNEVHRLVGGSNFISTGLNSPSIAIGDGICCEVFMTHPFANDSAAKKYVGPNPNQWQSMTKRRHNGAIDQHPMGREVTFENGHLWTRTATGAYRFESGKWREYFYNPLLAGVPMAPLGDSLYTFLHNELMVVNRDTMYSIGEPIPIWNNVSTEMRSAKSISGELYVLLNNDVIKILPDVLNADRPRVGTISANNLTASFTSSGSHFYGGVGSPGGMTLDGGSLMFVSNLWYRGLKNGSDTVLGTETYRQFGAQYYSGPKSNTYDQAYLDKYDRVWVVTKDQILNHQQNFRDSTYTAPFSIAKWPGNGDTTKGEGKFLAPFIDYNYNGIYEPDSGDVPKIRGQEAAYFIFNDFRGPSTDSRLGRESGDLEFHCMAYAYDSVNSPGLHNSIFLSYRIINRGTSMISSFEPIFWMDPDLGNWNDDISGCDSIRKEAYFYNGDLNDDGPTGIGINPPAMGIHFLSHEMSGFMSFSDLSPNSSLDPLDMPNTKLEAWTVMDIKWKNGNPILLENPSGLGSNLNGDGTDFPGHQHPSTKWLYNHAANWYAAPNTAGDKRGFAKGESFDLQAGEAVCMDFVLSVGRDLNATDIGSSVDVVKSHLDETKQFYGQSPFDCLAAGMSSDELDRLEPYEIRIYPNPISPGEKMEIAHSEKTASEIEIISIDGRSIFQSSVERSSDLTKIDIPEYVNSGVYLLKVRYADESISLNRFIVN